MAKTMLFSVKGMTCDNCVHHVTAAIQGVPGVRHAGVSLANHSAEVEGDFDPARVSAAVAEEGYEAEPKG